MEDRYYTLMSSGKLGSERRALQLRDIAQFPLVVPDSLDPEQHQAITACADALLANEPDWPELDHTVAGLYGLSGRDQQTMADTVATRAPFARVRKRAAAPATPAEKDLFRTRLETELASVLAAGGHRVRVDLLDPSDRHLPWRFVGVAFDGRPLPPALPTRWIETADDLAASRITVLDAREPCLAVGLLDRYRYWTQTQARLLASDLLWQYGAALEERARS